MSNSKVNIELLRAYSEINLSNLEHNLGQLQEQLPAMCKVIAVVKADAYGHGAVQVSRHLQRLGIEHFAVASIDEAIELRINQIEGEILVLGYTPIGRREDLIYYHITQALIDESYAEKISKGKGRLRVHIKLDTGMNRLGLRATNLDALMAIYRKENLEITGTFSHLSRADSLCDEDKSFTEYQIKTFYEIIGSLKKNHIEVGKTHLQSSYGIINYPQIKCDLASPGILLYGVSSNPEENIAERLDVRPVLSLRAKVGSIKHVDKGETVGYGNHFKVEKESVIAIVTIGYADGYPRYLSKRGCKVLIRGREVPIIGNVCMDQMIVDVTSLNDIKVGSQVTLIGKDEEAYLSVNQISLLTNTINNETLTGIGQRVKKVYI